MKIKKMILASLLVGSWCCVSCIDTDLEEVLEYKNHYQTIEDANSAILGLYGKFVGLAEQVIVLNELRGDLMDVTRNASTELQEINLNIPSRDNRYIDPTSFFSVIANCNDILFNFDKMLAEFRMTEDDYNELVSDVSTVRSWVYLQLAMHYGNVPYITDPIIDITDLKKYENIEKLSIDQLVDQLILCMEGLPTLEPYQNSSLIKYTLDGYELSNYFLNKRLMLADLYLWRNRYMDAATQYRFFLSKGENNDAITNYQQYTCYNELWATEGSKPPTFQICYLRYHLNDSRWYLNTWKNMFELPAENRYAKYELITTMSYDKSFQPVYPFVRLFANQGKGEYQLKPSQYAIDDLWEAQVQRNGSQFDGRGRESSFDYVNGDPIVKKYLYNYDTAKPFERAGKWWLYRAAVVHLRYAEAANRAGYPKLAYAILNSGIKNSFNWPTANNDERFLNNISGHGLGEPYPEPFLFKARFITDINPQIRDPWRQTEGIRGRATLRDVAIPETVITTQDSILFIEQAILNEMALECGFEGHRWGDLVRVARRKNAEDGSGTTYLQDCLRPKYEKSGLGFPDYSAETKWYLPLEL